MAMKVKNRQFVSQNVDCISRKLEAHKTAEKASDSPQAQVLHPQSDATEVHHYLLEELLLKEPRKAGITKRSPETGGIPRPQ